MKDEIDNEKSLKKALGIKSIAQMPLEKSLEFFQMVPRMSKEVQIKALEQMPEFRTVANTAIGALGKVLDSALVANHKSLKKVHKAYEQERAALMKILDKPDLTFQEQFLVMDRIAETTKLQQEVDAKNKKFVAGAAGTIASGIVAVTVTIIAIATGRSPK